MAKRAAEGLRYAALVDASDHHVLAEAGAALITKPFDLPGELERRGRRVRLVDALARLYARPGASERFPGPRPYLVVEFCPPVLDQLDSDLARISVVAAAAALVLVAFAVAWSRTT